MVNAVHASLPIFCELTQWNGNLIACVITCHVITLCQRGRMSAASKAGPYVHRWGYVCICLCHLFVSHQRVRYDLNQTPVPLCICLSHLFVSHQGVRNKLDCLCVLD